MLRIFFRKAFDIRDGELRISFFMQLYIFLLITVLLMVKPTINALFLSNLGAEQLPYGYILVAAIAVVTMFFYNKAVKRFSLRVITISTLVLFSISFLVLSFIMHTGILNNWVLYFYYLSVSLFAVLVTSQFWIIANMVYNAREAKRLFGFIGAGAIAGGIFGGYLTTLIASSFGNRIVILIAGIIILLCIPILQIVWKLRIRKLNSYIRIQRKTRDQSSDVAPFRLIIQSKHLTYLAAIVGVGVVMAKLVDFQFSDFANRAIPDSDELASFFGFWFSTFNVVALAIQLFLTNRLMAWLGVTTNLLILPLCIAIGCLLFLTFPELWVLIIIKGVDGSFKQSVNKAGIELSILPIPYHIKNEAKSYIDVVVDSVATGLAGLMLIFLIRKLDLSSSYITVIILLFLFIWVLLIYKLREAYFESFRKNIQNSLASNSVVTKKLSSERTVKSTIEILKSGDEVEILTLLDRLKDFRLNTLESHIVGLLSHPSNTVKIAAIQQLYLYKKGTAIFKIRELINEEDDTLVYVAMEYLLQHTDLNDYKIYESFLNSPSDYISNAALLCLAKESTNNKKLGLKYGLNSRIEKKIREFNSHESETRSEEVAELLIAIAHTGEEKYYSYISAHFNNIDPFVVKHAIKAAGITSKESFIAPLLDFLAEKYFRKTATKALRSYGVQITRTILKLDLAENIKEPVREHIPRVIESFGTKDSVRVLMRLLRSKDFIIRSEAAKSLSLIKEKNSNLPVDQRQLTRILLKETNYYKNSLSAIATIKKAENESSLHPLEDTDIETELQIARENILQILNYQLDQSLECIFKLLSLKYDQADIDVAYFGLKSDVKETKINAVEFLDNVLKSRLKNNMLPLIEYHIIETNEYGVSPLELSEMSETKCMLLLLKNRGVNTKLAVINLILQKKDRTFTKQLRVLSKHKNKKVRRSAMHTLQSLKREAIILQ
ncbi:Npt1/Npt2 family nucleotide transporter [Cochleicola gelatinilyticus]|uniref:ADP,ATP carrier protein n=1 Tax=Cochleicola gelatinilyticus TaxID=1763537 RepID=A0A167F1E6_9FLAO|nr:Npt1/Npt2 family nucleotide transporter [Cochleicola gelatinilyticus]OAB76090.1 ATP translocase [Cochleicola gelatinilyticus]